MDRTNLSCARRPLAAVAAAAIALVGTFIVQAPPARAASLVEVTSFGTNPGNLRMFKYVPTGLPSNAPVVVAMHGCTQSAASSAHNARRPSRQSPWRRSPLGRWRWCCGFAYTLPPRRRSGLLLPAQQSY